MRSSPSAEPGTGDGNRCPHQTFPGSALSRLRGGDHRISRGFCHVHPSAGDALVPERGAPRTTGTRAHIRLSPDRRFRAFAVETTASPGIPSHAHPGAGDALVPERGARNGRRESVPTSDFPRIGAFAPSRWRPPHLQGSPATPIPALAMRSSPSAEPGGRRESVPTSGLPRIGALAPSRWRPPHLQGVLPYSSQRWRCARPRARSPQGDGNRCPHPASPRASLRFPWAPVPALRPCTKNPDSVSRRWR
jgi:hypothetical protein